MPALSSVAQFAYDRGRITVPKVVQAINDPGAEIENILMPVDVYKRQERKRVLQQGVQAQDRAFLRSG